MPHVLFTPAALADVADATQWYEEQAPHMAAPFHRSLADVVARIAANPLQFPPSAQKTRRALLRRFPYIAVFREADDAIYVVAIFHTSRDPRIWRGR